MKGFDIKKEDVVKFTKDAAVDVGVSLAIRGAITMIAKGSGAIYKKMVKRKVKNDLEKDQTVVIIKTEKENERRPLTVEEFKSRFKKVEES